MNYIVIGVIAFLMILSFVFLIKSKVMLLMSFALKMGFLGLIAVCLSALFVPPIYNFLSDFTLKQTGTYDTIKDIDDKFIFDDLTDSSGNIIDNIKDLFGNDDSSDDATTIEKKGIFENNLYPTLVDVISFIYRIFAVILSLLGLIGIIYISYATQGATEMAELKHKYAQLEARVRQLESR